jgi:integrase
MHTLTDTAIRAAIRSGKARALSDGGSRGDGALVLRIATTGAAAWYLKRWQDGRPALVKLGAYPAVGLADARRRYRDHAGAALPHETPRATAARVTRERAELATLRDLAEAYCAHLGGRRSAREARRILIDAPDAAARFLPDGPANAIEPGDVAGWLARWADRGALVAGAQSRAILRAAFSFGQAHDFDPRRYVSGAPPPRFAIKANPAAAVPSFGARGAGTRWLSLDEIRTFWTWCGAGAGRTDPRALIALRLILTTGQRVEQVLKLTDAHLARRPGWMAWEAAEMKKPRPHAVPAVGVVAELVRWAVEAPRPRPGLLFPGTLPGEPYQHRSLNWIARRCCADTGLAPFTPRDLRRTWRTHAGEAGLSAEQCAALMAHPFGPAVESRHYNAGNNDHLKAEGAQAMAKYWEASGII